MNKNLIRSCFGGLGAVILIALGITGVPKKEKEPALNASVMEENVRSSLEKISAGNAYSSYWFYKQTENLKNEKLAEVTGETVYGLSAITGDGAVVTSDAVSSQPAVTPKKSEVTASARTGEDTASDKKKRVSVKTSVHAPGKAKVDKITVELAPEQSKEPRLTQKPEGKSDSAAGQAEKATQKPEGKSDSATGQTEKATQKPEGKSDSAAGQVEKATQQPGTSKEQYSKQEQMASIQGGRCSIMGTTYTYLEQMVRYYCAHAVYPEYYKKSDAPTIEKFCEIYIQEAQAEGVRAEVAFCQAMKETGYLKYKGDVRIEQYNFAGIGATGGGVPGNSFGSVRKGIRAQIQHLKAYASKDVLNQSCVDPRFKYVKRGTSPYVEWLGIQENPYKGGWAADPGYGKSIVKDYLSKLFAN